MPIVSLVKPRVTHVITSREIPRQTNVRPGISTLATSLPDEKKIKTGFFTQLLKWSKQSKLGEVLFKTFGLYIQLINDMVHLFSIDLGIDRLLENELSKHLFRTDLTDPIPPNIDLDSLIKLEENGEPTLYGHFYESKNSKLLAIYLHGFGSNIFEDIPNCLRIQKELGVNVLCFDYRGYGLSQGTPTIDGVTKDTIRMYNYATEVKGFDGKNIIFVGISLGGPIALEAYSVLKKQDKPLGGMALLYAFSSIRDITKWRFPEVPVYLLPDNKFNARRLAKLVTVPLHVGWGDHDNDTPNKQSELVYRNAPGQNKSMFILSGIGHNNLGLTDHPSINAYYASVREWLKKYFTST